MFTCHSVGKRKNTDILPDFSPLVGYQVSTSLSCLTSIFQSTNGSTIGESIIIDPNSVLIGSHHAANGIRTILIPFGTTYPKIGNCFHQWITVRTQPMQVMSDTIIVPTGNGNICCNVMFERSGQGKSRSRFFTSIVTFPRKHGTPVTMSDSTFASSCKTVGTVVHHRFGNALIEQ